MNKKFKLDPAVKAAWVQALYSGRYRQGFGALHENGAYCVLGVLAKEASLAQELRNADLPPSVLPYLVQKDLMLMNDNLQRDFPSIADYIEAEL